MGDFLNIITIFGTIGTIAISAITLFTTKALQQSQQRATIVATKRSERIDLMRELSAEIIGCGKLFLCDLDTSGTKEDLIHSAAKFTALLQYAYPYDVELIDNADNITELCLQQTVNKNALAEELHVFLQRCDLYVGAEYERLKEEAEGNIDKSGQLQDEDDTFKKFHTKIKLEQDKFWGRKKKPYIPDYARYNTK